MLDWFEIMIVFFDRQWLVQPWSPDCSQHRTVGDGYRYLRILNCRHWLHLWLPIGTMAKEYIVVHAFCWWVYIILLVYLSLYSMATSTTPSLFISTLTTFIYFRPNFNVNTLGLYIRYKRSKKNLINRFMG